jgi:hypothetical protein
MLNQPRVIGWRSSVAETVESALSSCRYVDVHRLREERCLRSPDGVFVCSSDDAVVLRRMYRCAAFVLPNTVEMPRVVRSRRHEAFTILFVGSMDYHPNEDAPLQLADVVLPCIYRSCQCPVQVLIVGNRPQDSVLALGARRCITVTGAVDNVTPYSGHSCCRAAAGRRGQPHQELLGKFSHRLTCHLIGLCERSIECARRMFAPHPGIRVADDSRPQAWVLPQAHALLAICSGVCASRSSRPSATS